MSDDLVIWVVPVDVGRGFRAIVVANDVHPKRREAACFHRHKTKEAARLCGERMRRRVARRIAAGEEK